MTKLTQILSYVDRRIAVLPLQGKQPLGAVAQRGVHSATTDAALVRSICARFPEANVGIAIGVGGLGDVRVLDVDPRNGGAVELGRLLVWLEELVKSAPIRPLGVETDSRL